MAIIDKGSATENVESKGFVGSYSDAEGWTVGFETYTEHADLSSLFVGLPDDRCQAVHLGYVVKGKLAFHYSDGQSDVIEAGQAYVTQPGHTPELFPDTEVVEFTRADELAKTMAVVEKNMDLAVAEEMEAL